MTASRQSRFCRSKSHDGKLVLSVGVFALEDVGPVLKSREVSRHSPFDALHNKELQAARNFSISTQGCVFPVEDFCFEVAQQILYHT